MVKKILKKYELSLAFAADRYRLLSRNVRAIMGGNPPGLERGGKRSRHGAEADMLQPGKPGFRGREQGR
jgi:hypothetical protein